MPQLLKKTLELNPDQKVFKVLQLVLHNDHYPYDQMLPILSKYYKNFSHVKTVFFLFFK